jgi:hypothetical protein
VIDQGWMVDDGTCDACLYTDCAYCPDTHDEFGDAEVLEICCCPEAYVLSRREP